MGPWDTSLYTPTQASLFAVQLQITTCDPPDGHGLQNLSHFGPMSRELGRERVRCLNTLMVERVGQTWYSVNWVICKLN